MYPRHPFMQVGGSHHLSVARMRKCTVSLLQTCKVKQ